MNLVEKVKAIAKLENIPESELIIEELLSFEKEHQGHGTWDVIIRYEQDGTLECIYAECTADDLINLGSECPTQDPDTIPELKSSFVYMKKKTEEIDLQRQRREGKINYYGKQLS